jgi:hypothetical protein
MPEPLYILGAAPRGESEVRTLTRQEGVRQLLEEPPFLRYSGWNLATLERAELASGPRLHIQNGQRKFFDLYADGTFAAIGVFDGFLGVGRWEFHRRPKVNGLAVVEFTSEFVLFYERLLHEYIEPLPDAARFSVKVRNQHFEQTYGVDDEDPEGRERKLRLSPGPVDNPFYDIDRFEEQEAPAEPLDVSLEVPVSADEPHLQVATVAYQLVRGFFNWFGLPDEAVPYTNEAGDAIDFEQITKPRS